MRDFAGLNAASVPTDPKDLPRYLPVLRRDMGELDYFLRDLSRGIARIQKGQVPDGSGEPIPIADDGFFFKLLGRPANQDAHGGTLASGSLTLSSTTSTTKGSIFLGDDHTTTYDETNGYFGVGTTSPQARLQANASTPSQILRPASLRSNNAWVDQAGSSAGADLVNATKDSSNSTYVRHGRTLGTIGLNLASGTDPGVDTGHTISVTTRVTAQIAGDYLVFDLEQGSTTIVSLHIPSGGTPPITTPDDTQLPLSFTTYTYTLTSAEASAISDYTNLNFGWTYLSGIDPSTFVDVSEVSLTLPGASATKLVRWSENNSSYIIDSAYANDANGAHVLAFTGTPKIAFQNTGLEFTIGSPTSGKFWRSQDTVGTGAWETITASAFPHVVLDSTVHTDTLTGTVLRGDLIVGNSTPKWSRLGVGSSGRVLTSDGTDASWQTLGAASNSVTAVTATYTAVTGDSVILASGTFTVNLYTAVGNTGKRLWIKNTGSGLVTADPNGSQTIDGALTVDIAAPNTLAVVSDNVNWQVI